MLIVTMIVSGLISSNIVNVFSPYLDAALKAGGTNDPGVLTAYLAIADIVVRVFLSLLVVALWGMGPASAGYTYILKNYANEEHAWVWSDFWEYTVKNFKQSICVWIIDIIVFALLVYAFMFYSVAGGFLQIIKYVIVCVFFVYTIMHFYIYQIMLDFKITLKEIFKNSFLLAILALPVNILIFILIFAIHLIMPYLGFSIPSLASSMGYWTIYIAAALFLLQGFSGLVTAFLASRAIKKYVVIPENIE